MAVDGDAFALRGGLLDGTAAGAWAGPAEEAVRLLYDSHYTALVRTAVLLVGDVPTAEEVVQDSFIAMYRAWWRLRDASKALPYLRSSVMNRAALLRRPARGADRRHLGDGPGLGQSPRRPSPALASGSAPLAFHRRGGAVSGAPAPELALSLFRSGRPRPADHDRLSWVRIVVTEVTGHGSIRRGVLDTAWHADAGRCRDLVEQAGLDVPPPYRPETGRPIYQIRVDDKVVWVAQRDLAGPLRELVAMTVLTDRPAPSPGHGGDQPRQAQPASGQHAEVQAPGEVARAQPEDMPAGARSPQTVETSRGSTAGATAR